MDWWFACEYVPLKRIVHSEQDLFLEGELCPSTYKCSFSFSWHFSFFFFTVKMQKKTLLICLQFTSVLGPVQPRQRDGRESNGLAGQGGNWGMQRQKSELGSTLL